MKRIICFLFILCVFNCCFSQQNDSKVHAETTTYAKVLPGCTLYKTKNFDNSLSNIYFIIPETYFVIVLETINDDCFKVQYDKYIGFVDSNTVEIATFVPNTKTLSNITFDIKNTSGTQIWQQPSTNSEICTTLSAGISNINYIAFAFGDIPTGGESNIWFFVSYTPNSSSTYIYEGYVYSENTTNLTEIVPNNESNPEIITDDTKDDKIVFFLSSTLKTIVISVIAIPILLFFVIILYKFVVFLRKKTNYNKNFLQKKSDIVDDNNRDDVNLFDKFKNLILLRHKKLHNVDFPNNDSDDELL